MLGFVYLWRDRKHNRYYVGSHFIGKRKNYICSSKWMMNAYRKRPEDFKRRILFKMFEGTRKDLQKIEQKWLDQIKPEELKNTLL